MPQAACVIVSWLPTTGIDSMSKRAAIYVRVSSELQAEKVSPQEQERECRDYAQKRGYSIADVYSDTRRYRAGGRLVEPSGTRSDRPELLRMLADAEDGAIDLVIAWREDRLYRGLRPMLRVLEMVEQGQAEIELVNETFDKQMAPIKASIAKIELEAFKERSALGVRARLTAGKSWGGYKKYGYARDGDQVVIHPEEAKWVRQIFDWHVTGAGVREIARRLITAGAPRKEGRSGRAKWYLGTLYRILNSDTYATGIHKVRRGSQFFELPVPKIIDIDVWQSAQEILKSNRQNQARNVKYRYLLNGILTCPCGTKWHSYTRTYTRYWTKKSTGERLPYETTQGYYRCPRVTATVECSTHPDCPRTKGVVRLDQYVWEKVSEVLRRPDLLFEAANAKLGEFKRRHANSTKTIASLEARLEELEQERLVYIRKFGDDSIKGGPFGESDLDAALSALSEEEVVVKRELAEASLLAETRIGDLETIIESYLTDIRAGIEWLDSAAQAKDESAEYFAERRKIVRSLVENVTLRRGADPEIALRLDLSPMVQIQSPVSSSLSLR